MCAGGTRQSAFGPLVPFAFVRFRVASGWRGRRCPAGTHAVAVSASLRLRCGARPSLASQNSLRSLRSLRSDSCDESVYEARCARRLKACAPRRHRNRAHRAPPAALYRLSFSWRETPAAPQRRARTGHAAPLRRREAQGSRPRAQRESSTDSSRLFERSERSERSEFRDGATRPSIAGKSERSVDRRGEASLPVRARLCHPGRGAQGRRTRTAATDRNQTFRHPRPLPRGPREARWTC